MKLRIFPRTLLALFVTFKAISLMQAQTPPAAAVPASIPEIEALRAPYLRSLAAFRASREARCEPLQRSYLGALDRLEKEFAARAELEPAKAVKTERERFTAKIEPSADERVRMPSALSALRVRYESDFQSAAAPLLVQEQQLTRQYGVLLDGLQRRLLSQNQIQKAALVGAERATLAGMLPAAIKSEPASKPIAASTIRNDGKLDPSAADKIAAAAVSKAYARTDDSGQANEKLGWMDVPEGGALLAGFEFFEVNARDGQWIRSLRPYFLTREGVVAGKDRGKMEKVTSKVLARPGYAVSGLVSIEAKKGLQVIFSKIDPVKGGFDPAPSSSYKSTWFGTKTRGPQKQIGGGGRFIIGVFGKTGSDCDTLGLVEMN